MSFDKEVNKDCVKKVKEYLRNEKSGKTYTFTDFFIRNGYIKDDRDLQYKGDNIFTHCPFHTDKTPSFSFSDEKRICKCFSCNFGGTFFDFLLRYENSVNGRTISYYGLMNELLENDPIMQANVGFSTIYTIHNIYKGDITYKPFRPKNLKKAYLPQTYLELAKRIKKDKLSDDVIFKFILLMQMGILSEDIYKEIYENKTAPIDNVEIKNESNNKIYDFTELLEED